MFLLYMKIYLIKIQFIDNVNIIFKDKDELPFKIIFITFKNV